MDASQQTADEVAERLFGSLLGTVEVAGPQLRVGPDGLLEDPEVKAWIESQLGTPDLPK